MKLYFGVQTKGKGIIVVKLKTHCAGIEADFSLCCLSSQLLNGPIQSFPSGEPSRIGKRHQPSLWQFNIYFMVFQRGLQGASLVVQC